MANPEHFEILKQGVEVWNKWRKDNPDIIPNLADVQLAEKNFNEIDFSSAVLRGASFISSHFQKANFSSASLENAHFLYPRLQDSLFVGADLYSTHFIGAEFHRANMQLALIIDTIFSDSVLIEVDFDNSILDEVSFANCNLSQAINLETVSHNSPSSIGIDTIYRSSNNIPEVFLRGCGVPETFITYAKSLIDNPIEYYSCFISFTEKDDAFSERLYNDMQAKGVRCWRWKEDAKWGRTLRKEIDEAVRYYDKLVVICSKDSLKAAAVLEEIERALDKEDMLKRKGDEGEVLFPIAIDRYIFDEWQHELKVRLMRKTIGNFYDCGSDLEKYRRSVERLIRDLNRSSGAR